MAVTKQVMPDGSVRYMKDGNGEGGGEIGTEDDYLNDKISTGVNDAIAKQKQAQPGIDAEGVKNRQLATFGAQAPTQKLNVQKIEVPQINPELLAQREKFIQGNRDALSRQFNARSQDTQDTLARRFSSMGMGNSGAALKTSLNAENEIGQARLDAENQVGQQALASQLQMEEQSNARQFAANQANADLATKGQMFDIEQGDKRNAIDMAQKQFILDQDTTEFNKRIAEIESRKPSGGGGGGCCFIFLEARYGTGLMDSVVRRYRDEHMTKKNARGYYKLAEVLVPIMRKSKLAKLAVRAFMTDPMVSYGKYHYGQNMFGFIFKPVVSFWMKAFDYLGGEHEYIRENGEVI